MPRHLRKEDIKFQKLANFYSQYKYQCKHCGRKELISPFKDKTVCTWCGHYIYREDKQEFKDRLNSLIKEKNNEQ